MTRQGTETRIIPVLLAAFTLLIMLLAGATYVALGAMQAVEADTVRLVENQQGVDRFIEELQAQEEALSAVADALATRPDKEARRPLEERLAALQQGIRRTTDAGRTSPRAALWNGVREAVDAMIEEGHRVLNANEAPTRSFYRYHQSVNSAIAELASAELAASSTARKEATQRAARQFRYSLFLLGVALLVAVSIAVATAYFVKRIVDQLRWQASELSLLSSRVMSDQEESARRFSRELHDHFGQTLSAIEANLAALQGTKQYHQGRIDDCMGLLKDAVDNVREVAQLLRPSILDDFGLAPAIRWLADGFAERTGVRVTCDLEFDGRLKDEHETQLFRITQEALTNIARHAHATEVHCSLRRVQDKIELVISDNGTGLKSAGEPFLDHPRGGLGLTGMRSRARAAGGELSVDSENGRGVRIRVRIPFDYVPNAKENPHFISR